MKKFISLVLVFCMAMLLAGCGEKERVLYSAAKLEKYVTLGEYTGIKIDTSSSSYKEIYDACIESDVSAGGYYVKKTQGTIAEGDTANIDYTGKKDGVAFEGGTAEGYDLEIGSGSFIPGFEDGLIGKEIGSTVDLNLTFPEEYQSEELAGKAVVFTVKINYVTSTEAQKPEEYFADLGFKSLKEYEADLSKRANVQAIFNKIEKDSKIKDYPEEDAQIVYDAHYNLMNLQFQTSYGATIEQIIQTQGMTEDEFKDKLMEESVYPEMNETMIYYAILDEEGLTVTADDTKKALKKFKKEMAPNATEDQIKESFGDYYFEAMAVEEIVGEFLLENAVIKK